MNRILPTPAGACFILWIVRISSWCFLVLLLLACADEPTHHPALQEPIAGSGGNPVGGVSGSSGFSGATATGGVGQGGSGAGGVGAGGVAAGNAGVGGAGSGQGGASGGAGSGGAGEGGGEAGGISGSSGDGGSGGAGAGGASAGAGGAVDPCALVTNPPGPFPGLLLADLPLKSASDGGETSVLLHSLRAVCEAPGVLVVQIEPAWCGPCEARADRVAGLLSPFAGASVQTVSVLYAGPDNARTTAEDLAAWRAKHPSLPGLLARPEDEGAISLVRTHTMVPLVLFVDARTLGILSVERAPRDRAFQEALAKALALAGGPTIALGPDPTTLVDERFDAADWEQIQRMAQPWAPLPSPSNAHADDPAAAALGELLFFDKDLAGSGGISCASCHDPAKGYADGLPVAQGIEKGGINSPTVAGAAAHRWFFWNGRADSLWAQALGPLENPIETGGSRLHVAHRVQETYAAVYEAVFGPLPDLQDTSRFPLEGKPGDASYDAMSAADQEAVTRVFVRVGKAIEAFERTIAPPKTRLDAYAAGDFNALLPGERDGLQGFLRGGCVACHHGPALSDGAFHDLWMPSSVPPAEPGRIEGLALLLESPFRRDGPYSDDPQAGSYPASLVPGDEMLGQIRTPSLRNVAATGPWGHGGTFPTLGAVLNHYLTVRILPPKGPQITGELDPATGSMPGNIAGLAEFLAMLGEAK